MAMPQKDNVMKQIFPEYLGVQDPAMSMAESIQRPSDESIIIDSIKSFGIIPLDVRLYGEKSLQVKLPPDVDGPIAIRIATLLSESGPEGGWAVTYEDDAVTLLVCKYDRHSVLMANHTI